MIQIEVLSVRSPQWANPAHTAVNCLVQTNYLKNEVPFTATPNDVMAHGRKVFEQCVAGTYGPVADYTSPPEHLKSEPDGSAELPLHWPEVVDFLQEANLENERGTNRGIVLVWGCMLETMMGRTLERFLVPNKSSVDQIEKLSFKARICKARNEDLITISEEATSNSIREVRNFFAHEWNCTNSNPRFYRDVFPHLKSLFSDFSGDTMNFYDDLDYLIKFGFSVAAAHLIIRLSSPQ